MAYEIRPIRPDFAGRIRLARYESCGVRRARPSWPRLVTTMRTGERKPVSRFGTDGHTEVRSGFGCSVVPGSPSLARCAGSPGTTGRAVAAAARKSDHGPSPPNMAANHLAVVPGDRRQAVGKGTQASSFTRRCRRR
ncbi:hypothetical protein BV133_1618 [Blastochloris viridis]|uniref:Uncharacterized protein n=1 Tax=Blastochloris viridis TaxID=1079 RepID=A0A182D2S7_BLAVI|nr:hypothetical protein BV133_1618 [Blastochloris viridis]